MSEPTWKSFANNIKSGGGGYDDRMPAGAVPNGIGAIQRELVEEMSGALRRAARKIESNLVELAELDDAIRSAPNRERQDELVQEFNELRAEALEARRHYLIQREAIGFFRNGSIYEQWPIPPKRTVVGPRGEDGTVGQLCRSSSGTDDTD